MNHYIYNVYDEYRTSLIPLKILVNYTLSISRIYGFLMSRSSLNSSLEDSLREEKERSPILDWWLTRRENPRTSNKKLVRP